MSHPLTIEFGVRALEIATEVKVSTDKVQRDWDEYIAKRQEEKMFYG